MRDHQTGGHFAGDPSGLLRRQRAAPESYTQGLAVEELGDQYGRPSSTPTSKTLTMFAWSSAAVTRASCRNRSMRCVSSVPAWASSFSATSRCRRTSVAR